jgi:tetraacyldisaccharide 4'-kinase
MAQAAPQARIVVDPKRIRSGPWIWKQWQPDLFLLDDGFQHLSIIRDLDLLLLLPSDLDQDWDQTIPSGPWREGCQALARASALLIKADARERECLDPLVRSRLDPLRKPSLPLFSFSLQVCALSELGSDRQTQTLDHPYLLVSSIADPSSVEQTAITHLSAPLVKHMAFADHYPFSRGDILEIYRQAASMNLRDVVCTAKDAVKIKPLLGQDTTLRWWRLDMEVAFDRPFDHLGDGHENFANWLSKWWETSAFAAFR